VVIWRPALLINVLWEVIFLPRLLHDLLLEGSVNITCCISAPGPVCLCVLDSVVLLCCAS